MEKGLGNQVLLQLNYRTKLRCLQEINQNHELGIATEKTKEHNIGEQTEIE